MQRSSTRTLRAHAFPLAATLLILTPLSAAQFVGGDWQTRYSRNGTEADQRFGSAVAGPGDLNRDGFPDYLIGAIGEKKGGAAAVGAVYIFNGRTGAQLGRLLGKAANDNYGFALDGAGDVDGDGYIDIAIGAWAEDSSQRADVGSAYVYSGATGALIWQFRGVDAGDAMGYSVAGAGDVNLDGFGDILVGTVGLGTQDIDSVGGAILFSGFDGQEIRRFKGVKRDDRLGHSVAGVGDVDGDGYDDQAIGSPLFDLPGKSNAGAVVVVSGLTGAAIHVFEGEGENDFFGLTLAGAGDVDEDGYPDVLVGASGADPGTTSNAGAAYLFSGKTGDLLLRLDGETDDAQMGISVDGAGDVDGDGRLDLIVGAHFNNPNGVANAGSAYVVSGLDGKIIRRFDGTASNDTLGVAVAGLGDVDGDGRSDILVGADKADNGSLADAGATQVISLVDPYLELSSHELSSALGSSITATIDFPQSEVGYSYVLLASAAGTGPTTMGGLEIPLTRDAVFDSILGGNPPNGMSGTSGVLDFDANATATIESVPGMGGTIGQTYYLAAVSYHPLQLLGRLSSMPRPITIVP